VALGERATVDKVDCLVGEIQQADRMREVAAAAAEPAGETCRRDIQFVQERGDRPGLLTGAGALFEPCRIRMGNLAFSRWAPDLRSRAESGGCCSSSRSAVCNPKGYAQFFPRARAPARAEVSSSSACALSGARVRWVTRVASGSEGIQRDWLRRALGRRAWCSGRSQRGVVTPGSSCDLRPLGRGQDVDAEQVREDRGGHLPGEL